MYEVRMSSALNRSSAIWRFEGSNAIEIRDGITFDFYTGLPHMLNVTTPYLLQRCRSQNVVKMVVCSCPAVVDLNIVRPDLKFQLGFTVKDGVVRSRPSTCSYGMEYMYQTTSMAVSMSCASASFSILPYVYR